MPATTGGYQTIDDGMNRGLKANNPPSHMALPMSVGDGTGGGQMISPNTNPSAQRIQNVANRAGAVAIGAREAVTQLISGPNPEMNLYTEPLNPGAQLTMNDRVQLVLESCRPWSEFADIKAMNLPNASETKLRIGHNIEIFFYNYLVVGFGLLGLTAFVHPLRAILVGLTVIMATLLYVIFPENYQVSDSFFVTPMVKHVIMGIVGFIALFFGGVLSLVFFFLSIFIPVVLLHSFLREHSAIVVSTI